MRHFDDHGLALSHGVAVARGGHVLVVIVGVDVVVVVSIRKSLDQSYCKN
jgi:hypothetical protein